MKAYPPPELLVDEYQLAMADSYVAQGIADDPVVFELFARSLPRHRGYLVAAGIEQALEYLGGLSFGPEALGYLRGTGSFSAALLERLAGERFDGDVDAVAEGGVVFAGEPLLQVRGRRLVCQFVESFLLNQVNFQTLIATKARRMVDAAEGRPVVDFGFRRAHGADAGVLAARAAYVGGCAATATVAAGYLYGIPTTGTMAHSYVLGFADEVEAFSAFLRDHPQRSTLLIDTYNTLRGARHAVEAAERTGVVPQAVRLDSGNIPRRAPQVRAILDEAGLTETQILCSGDLNEYAIARLVAGESPVDGFGVGTELVTSADAPALGGVYKLVESAGRPVMKRSGAKSNLPGAHQVFRVDGRDVIGLADEDLPGRRLLEPAIRAGRRVAPAPPLAEARERAVREVEALPARVRELTAPATLRTALSTRLAALRDSLL